MTNQQLLERLNQIGKLPTADIADETDFPLKEFDDLLQEFTLPIDFDTAVQLINLSPPVGEGCHGVEWDLVHLVECIEINQLQKILYASNDGAVKRHIQIGLDNYNKSQNN